MGQNSDNRKLHLAQSRWQLRGAVKVVNQSLGALNLEKHPDKTFIGRIERGFDFLGYHFSPAGLAVAKQTIANFIEKASRLSIGDTARRYSPAARACPMRQQTAPSHRGLRSPQIRVNWDWITSTASTLTLCPPGSLRCEYPWC